jgi:hypothetical protein
MVYSTRKWENKRYVFKREQGRFVLLFERIGKEKDKSEWR